MSVYDHWQAQHESLRTALDAQPDMAGIVYQVRHALLQTEQNALAELTDDVLRQQAGVLMSALKSCIGLLEANIATQVWVPQKAAAAKPAWGRWTLWAVAAAVLFALGGYGYLKGDAIIWLAALAALASGAAALITGRKKAQTATPQDEARVTLKPDLDRLFSILDGQVRAVDRSLNDLAYLNEQLRSGADLADTSALARAAGLMESLYDIDGVAASPALDAARGLLASLGLCALDYSSENQRLFNALPSKSETRTLSPAILSAQDHRLLRRGTAAVRINAA